MRGPKTEAEKLRKTLRMVRDRLTAEVMKNLHLGDTIQRLRIEATRLQSIEQEKYAHEQRAGALEAQCAAHSGRANALSEVIARLLTPGHLAPGLSRAAMEDARRATQDADVAVLQPPPKEQS